MVGHPAFHQGLDIDQSNLLREQPGAPRFSSSARTMDGDADEVADVLA